MTPKQKKKELENSIWDEMNSNLESDSGINGMDESAKDIAYYMCSHSLELIETFKDSVYYEHAKAFYTQVRDEYK